MTEAERRLDARLDRLAGMAAIKDSRALSMLADEAAFLAAEQNIAELRRQIAAINVTSIEEEKALIGPLEKRMWELYDAVIAAPPTSHMSALIKLRLLGDPAIGVDAGSEHDDEAEAIRQVGSFLEAEGRTPLDPLIAMIRERSRLFRVAEEIRERADEIRLTLPEAVQKGEVLITFSAGFNKPGNFDFKTEMDVKAFAEGYRRAVWRDRPIPHWDRIVAQLLEDFRAAKKAQIDDVLEASGCAALLREVEELEQKTSDLEEQIYSTPATSCDALLWQLEALRDETDDKELLDTIVAGVRGLAGSECNTELVEELMKTERGEKDEVRAAEPLGFYKGLLAGLSS
jgi:hypothetical protein